jgi:hypothetical protein
MLSIALAENQFPLFGTMLVMLMHALQHSVIAAFGDCGSVAIAPT